MECRDLTWTQNKAQGKRYQKYFDVLQVPRGTEQHPIRSMMPSSAHFRLDVASVEMLEMFPRWSVNPGDARGCGLASAGRMSFLFRFHDYCVHR